MSRPRRWAIVLVDLDPTVGLEQSGQRRALVVSYEAFHASRMAAVCPISARPRSQVAAKRQRSAAQYAPAMRSGGYHRS